MLFYSGQITQMFQLYKIKAKGVIDMANATKIVVGGSEFNVRDSSTTSALRTDFSVLMDLLIQFGATNILNFVSWHDGYYVSYSTGNLLPLDEYSATDYIPVMPNTIIRTVGKSSGSQYSFYDKNFTFVSGSTQSGDDITVPSTSSIAYIRWCTDTANKGSASMKYNFTLDGINDEIGNIICYIYTLEQLELLSKNLMIDGYYVQASDGELSDNVDWTTSGYIRVIPGIVLSITNGNAGSQVAFYNADKQFVSGQVINAATSVSVPQTTSITYMRWCTTIAKKNNASVKFVASSRDNYIITPSIGLLHGVINAYAANKTKVIVMPGTYDLISEYQAEYGSDYFTSYSGTYNEERHGYFDRGLWLDNIEIKFMAGTSVTCNYTGDNNDVKTWFSAFAVGSNAIIDGLVLDASNLRYGIHPDFHPSDTETIVFKNCDLHHYAGDDGVNNNQAIGAGLGIHSNWLVENCIFRSDTDHPIMRIHNHVSSSAKSKIIIKDCYIIGSGYIRLNSYSVSTLQTIALVSGCSWITPASVGKETADSNDNITMYAWNNETRQS